MLRRRKVAARPGGVVTTVDLTLGRRIRAARKESGVTQTAMAEACGVTFQQIQKYEAGKNRVSMSRLTLIAKAVGKPMEFFYNSANPHEGAEESTVITKMLGEPHGVDLARAFLQINNKGRKMLVDMAVSLSKSDQTEH